MKVRGDVAPPAAFRVELQPNRPDRSRVIFWENPVEFTETGENGETRHGWEYDEYVTVMVHRVGLVDEIAQNLAAYLSLARDADYEATADRVRGERNELLAASDAEMCIDRMGLVPPEGTTITSWLSFLRALGSAVTGATAIYRQALRDIPNQEGFPYSVTWPEKPE